MIPNALYTVSTSERQRDSVGISALRRQEATLFCDDFSQGLSDYEDTGLLLAEVFADESLPRSPYSDSRQYLCI